MYLALINAEIGNRYEVHSISRFLPIGSQL